MFLGKFKFLKKECKTFLRGLINLISEYKLFSENISFIFQITEKSTNKGKILDYRNHVGTT